MYESFYGLDEKPFSITPDPKYLFLSSRHSEAIAHLEFGRRERGGFVVITGEVGTGKTMLARHFLGRLGEEAVSATVLYPALTAAELLRTVLDDFHVTTSGTSLKELIDALHRFLLETRAARRDVVLLIDEAQDLSPEVLEQVRLLSNLETDTEKLIQIILVGQSELRSMLGRRELRQLSQRVTARYHLSPLGRDETGAYVRHRLRVAGGEGKVGFTSSALVLVHTLSGGIPRLINLLCDRALLGGYASGIRSIPASLVRQAAHEVLPPEPARRRRRVSLAASAALLLALAATVLWLRSPRWTEPAPVAAAASDPPALEASSVPAPAPPSPIPSPTSALADLTPIVMTLDHRSSLEGAVAQVRALWGPSVTLQTTEIRTHLEQVRRFDVPVVLEMFHPARRDSCFLALVSLDGETAWISTGTGVPVAVGARQLDQLWTRQATFFWRDFDSLFRAPRRARAWASERLTELGYGPPGTGLPALLAHFQNDQELAPDGVLGDRTLMALYSLGDYPRPRLARSLS